MTNSKQPVALLIPLSLSKEKAGGAMRCRAISEALGHCQVIGIRCDRRSACGTICVATGGHPPSLGARNYFTYNYCDGHADQIARELITAGVRTVICSTLLTHRYAVRLSEYAELRVIYDMHNIEFPLRREILAWSGVSDVKYPFTGDDLIRNAENAAIGAANQIWTCSAADAQLLRETYPEHSAKEICVVPNVVEVTEEPPRPAPVPSRIAFTGHLSWYPNVIAARYLINEIAPALRGRGCDIPIVIAGSSPQDEILEAAADSVPNVHVIADPEATASLISGSVMTIPLTIGGGTRLKVLEAFALGAPVVSTAKGVEGLDLQRSVHYAEADKPEEFAASIAELLSDEQGRTEMVSAAWRIACDRYSVEALRKRLSTILG